MYFATSDYHLAHANIIKYSNRPFNSVEEMNQVIFDRVNERVGPDDHLLFLGDFAFDLRGDLEKVYAYRRRIVCRTITFVIGNHDHLIVKNRNKLVEDGVFNRIADVWTIRDTKPNIFLSHYAHKVWDKAHHGVFHCYAHSHGTLPEDPNSLSFDVGVDTNNFYPYSFDDVVAKMNKKTWKPLDHHNKSTRE